MFNKRKQAAGAGAHGSVLVSEGRTDLSGNGAGAIADPNRDYLAAKSEAHTDMRFTSYLGNKERSNTNVLSMFQNAMERNYEDPEGSVSMHSDDLLP